MEKRPPTHSVPWGLRLFPVVVHHTPTGGSSVVVAISVWPYGVDRPPLSWLRVGVHERAKM